MSTPRTVSDRFQGIRATAMTTAEITAVVRPAVRGLPAAASAPGPFPASERPPDGTRPGAPRSRTPPRPLIVRLPVPDKALLCGINEYQSVNHLRGCVNDVENMRQLLNRRFRLRRHQREGAGQRPGSPRPKCRSR